MNSNFWPFIRGHLVTSMRSIWKSNDIFVFLDPKKIYFNIHHAKLVNWKFWPLIGGQRSLVTSMKSKWKNNVIFGFLGPKNLYFNIHHAKLVISKFWPLIRGQRSNDDLQEVNLTFLWHVLFYWSTITLNFPKNFKNYHLCL